MSKVMVSVCLEEDFLKEIDITRGREKRSSYLRYLVEMGFGVDRVLRAKGISAEDLKSYLTEIR